jgi:hypothetical protein
MLLDYSTRANLAAKVSEGSSLFTEITTSVIEPSTADPHVAGSAWGTRE